METNQGQTVLAHVLRYVSHDDFRRCVDRYHGNRGIRRLSCWDQFLAMAFAQLTYRESLRDIEVCLGAHGRKLYHAGFRGAVKRSTLAEANEHRDWRIYADWAQTLILARVGPLHVWIVIRQVAYFRCQCRPMSSVLASESSR